MKKDKRPRPQRKETRRPYSKPRVVTTEAFESASADCSKGMPPTLS